MHNSFADASPRLQGNSVIQRWAAVPLLLLSTYRVGCFRLFHPSQSSLSRSPIERKPRLVHRPAGPSRGSASQRPFSRPVSLARERCQQSDWFVRSAYLSSHRAPSHPPALPHCITTAGTCATKAITECRCSSHPAGEHKDRQPAGRGNAGQRKHTRTCPCTQTCGSHEGVWGCRNAKNAQCTCSKCMRNRQDKGVAGLQRT